MKKATATSRILFITFILLSGFLLDARVTISKIEYFPGEDFVQLHMQTDKILPIPDIFYPQKDNLNRLVMRIKDVDFKVDDRFAHVRFSGDPGSEHQDQRAISPTSRSS